MSSIEISLEQCSETAMRLNNNVLDVIVDRPKEKGGRGEGLMGGQYLLAGIGGCFCSTLFAAAQSRQVEIEGLHVSVQATLSEDLPKRFRGVSLVVSYKKCSNPASLPKLLKVAEKGCLSINTIKTGMDFSLSEPFLMSEVSN